jgi:hypothetical protein
MYLCSKCNYTTISKAHYEKHISSSKHKEFSCDICNKIYKTRSGLWKHKNEKHKNEKHKNEKHNKIINESVRETFNEALIETSKYTNNKQIEKLTEIIENTLLKQKNILENTINNQDKIIKNLIPKVGNTINNKISINVFLKEKCAGAINFNDFLKQIKVDLNDLHITKELGYIDGISSIFMKQLCDMSTTDRPIHCSDKKRLHFYIKDRNEWGKGEKTTVEHAITHVARKQISQIKEWEKKHPNWDKNTKETDEYLKLIKVVMGGSTDEEQEKNTKGIVRMLGDKLHLSDKKMFNI